MASSCSTCPSNTDKPSNDPTMPHPITEEDKPADVSASEPEPKVTEKETEETQHQHEDTQADSTDSTDVAKTGDGATDSHPGRSVEDEQTDSFKGKKDVGAMVQNCEPCAKDGNCDDKSGSLAGRDEGKGDAGENPSCAGSGSCATQGGHDTTKATDDGTTDDTGDAGKDTSGDSSKGCGRSMPCGLDRFRGDGKAIR